MVTVTLVVASIALADSINPSTIVPALWVASNPRAHVLSFTIGAFAVYFAGGLVIAFGPGPLLISALHHVQGSVEHALEVAGGVLVLALAVWLWRSRHSERVTKRARPGCTRASAFGLGAGIMAIELPTAFIYFGAISAVLASHQTAPVTVSLLVVYNALFVAPLLAILAIRRLAGERGERWLAAAWERLIGFGQALLAGLTGSGGVALLVVGVAGLLAS
jgi:cytochrome c biogenesis protein CcdA